MDNETEALFDKLSTDLVDNFDVSIKGITGLNIDKDSPCCKEKRNSCESDCEYKLPCVQHHLILQLVQEFHEKHNGGDIQIIIDFCSILHKINKILNCNTSEISVLIEAVRSTPTFISKNKDMFNEK